MDSQLWKTRVRSFFRTAATAAAPGATVVWNSLIKLWPLLVVALLFYGAKQLVDSNNKAVAKAASLKTEVAVLETALEEETAVGDVLADQADKARAANRQKDRDLASLRNKYATLHLQLVSIGTSLPTTDCFHQPVDPRVSRMLYLGSFSPGTVSDRESEAPKQPRTYSGTRVE